MIFCLKAWEEMYYIKVWKHGNIDLLFRQISKTDVFPQGNGRYILKRSFQPLKFAYVNNKVRCARNFTFASLFYTVWKQDLVVWLDKVVLCDWNSNQHS